MIFFEFSRQSSHYNTSASFQRWLELQEHEKALLYLPSNLYLGLLTARLSACCGYGSPHELK